MRLRLSPGKTEICWLYPSHNRLPAAKTPRTYKKSHGFSWMSIGDETMLPPLVNTRTLILGPHNVIPMKYQWFSCNDRVKKALSAIWMWASFSSLEFVQYFISQMLAKVFQFNTLSGCISEFMAKSGFLRLPMSFLSWGSHVLFKGPVYCAFTNWVHTVRNRGAWPPVKYSETQ